MSDLVAAIAELMAIALATAASPLPMTAALVVLMAPGGRRLAWLFAVGWGAALFVLASIASIAAGALPSDDDPDARGPYPIVPIAAGALLVGIGIAQWRRARQRNSDAPPRWLARLDGLTPTRAVLVGAAFAVLKPKNIALVIAAGLIAGRSPLTIPGTLLLIAVYALVASSTIVAPVLVFTLGGELTRARIAAVREWVVGNLGTITAAVLVVLGVVLLVIGALDVVG